MNRRILVVEDDSIQADSISHVLKERGYNAKSALNGDAALSVLAVQQFDILLVDLYMPGINGVELTQKLRGLCHSKVPIVLMTAADTEVIERIRSHSKSLQPMVIMQKPFTMDALISTLTKLKDQTDEDGEKEHSPTESVLSPMPRSTDASS